MRRRSPRIAKLSGLRNLPPRVSIQGILDRVRSPRGETSTVERGQLDNDQPEEEADSDIRSDDAGERDNEESISSCNYSSIDRATKLQNMIQDYVNKVNSWMKDPENPEPSFPTSSIQEFFSDSTNTNDTNFIRPVTYLLERKEVYEVIKSYQQKIDVLSKKDLDNFHIYTENIIMHLRKYANAIGKAAFHLHHYSGLGNETEVSRTEPKTGVKIDADRIDTQYDGHVKPSEEELQNINTCKEEYISHLLEQASLNLGNDKMKKLQSFYDYVKGVFEKATPVKSRLHRKRELTSRELTSLKNTRDTILQWEEHPSMIPNRHYGKPSRKWDDETTAGHPILQAIVFVIRNIVSSSTSETSLKVTSDITKERNIHPIHGPVATVSTTKGRRIDIMHGISHREYMTVIHSSMLRTPIEFKTAPDDNDKLKDTINKGSNQIYSHLSKKVTVDLHFAGIGKNGSATGIVLTQHAFKVIKLFLSDAGTQVMKLGCIETPIINLWDSLTQQGDDDMGNEIRTSFHVLAGALIEGSTKNEKMDDSDEIIFSCDDYQGVLELEYLGSGSFANVFAVPSSEKDINRKLFWKVPKCVSLEKNLKNEAKILRILNRDSNHQNIPATARSDSCLTSVSLTRKKTYQLSKIRVLELRGVVGKNLHQMSIEEWSNLHGIKVIKQVLLALNHAHEKNVVHLDIRPGNITYYLDEKSQNLHVMLIDWGCAVKKDREGGFRGTVPYAHDNLMQLKQKITFDDAFDYASLMYTVDHCRVGKLRWNHSFDRPSAVGGEQKKLRRGYVKESLEWFNMKMNEELLSTKDPFFSTFRINVLYKACGITYRMKRKGSCFVGGKNKRDR